MIRFENISYIQIPSRREYIDLVISKIFKTINSSVEIVNKINLSFTNTAVFDNAIFGFGVNLAIDEAIQNALSHGNLRDPSKVINISYNISPDFLKISIMDQGDGFNIESYRNNRDDNPEAGRGIILMRNFMDKVYYNDKGNKVTMIKYHNIPEAESIC